MSRVSSGDLAAALVSELTRALRDIVPDITVTVTQPTRGSGWHFVAEASGDFDGSVALWVDRRGTAPLMARLLSAGGTPTEAETTSRLSELWATVVGAVIRDHPYQGVTIQSPTASFAESPSDAAWLDIVVESSTARVAIAVRDRVQTEAGEKSHLEALLDIDLPLVARFARTVMSIKSLSSVGPGTVVDMERSPDAPVDLLVGNRLIAQGEVVVVNGNYGVRVTRLCHPAKGLL
jgi:flagellar motor switch protein FliN/FliY